MRLSYLVLGAYTLAGITSSYAAPPQLYNKTVSIAWSDRSTVRSPDGIEKQGGSDVKYIVFVSSAGRLFMRSSLTQGTRSARGDADPGEVRSKNGEAHGWTFNGNTMVFTRGYGGGGGSGALHLVVSFDPTYSSCSLKVSHGREDGRHLKRKSLDGVTREFWNTTYSNQSCSVQSGNPFANN